MFYIGSRMWWCLWLPHFDMIVSGKDDLAASAFNGDGPIHQWEFVSCPGFFSLSPVCWKSRGRPVLKPPKVSPGSGRRCSPS
ncbi:hypothetical protein PSAB6_120003 [Paraburkholderia sabiae]|nr:hypothetical protein PSAB6_120003 [Paraburkholderia sabiae]